MASEPRMKNVAYDDLEAPDFAKPLSERPGFSEQQLRGENVRELSMALRGRKTFIIKTAGAHNIDTPISAEASIGNSTTETTLYTRAIAANALVAGQQFRIRLAGRYSTANGTDVNTLRFKIGGSTAITVVTVAGTVTNKPWYCELIFTVRSIGASGSIQFNVRAESNGVIISTSAAGPKTVDTTAACDITFTSQWSAATSGSTMYIEQGSTEVITVATTSETAVFENGVLVSSS